jgi:dUTP pyrophosphatase
MDEKVIIKFVKTHPNAKLPSKAHPTDNCFDLFCCEETVIPATKVVDGKFVLGFGVVPIGLNVASISKGHGFVTKNKSGLSFKHKLLRVAGEFDEQYRSGMDVGLINLSDQDYKFQVGDKVVQIKIEKVIDTEVMFADEIEISEDNTRMSGGFGSSGKK